MHVEALKKKEPESVVIKLFRLINGLADQKQLQRELSDIWKEIRADPAIDDPDLSSLRRHLKDDGDIQFEVGVAKAGADAAGLAYEISGVLIGIATSAVVGALKDELRDGMKKVLKKYLLPTLRKRLGSGRVGEEVEMKEKIEKTNPSDNEQTKHEERGPSTSAVAPEKR